MNEEQPNSITPMREVWKYTIIITVIVLVMMGFFSYMTLRDVDQYHRSQIEKREREITELRAYLEHMRKNGTATSTREEYFITTQP